MPAVTELIVAELLYLQYRDRNKPMYLYINSTGTTRADGETVRRLIPPVMFIATDEHRPTAGHLNPVSSALQLVCELQRGAHICAA